MLTLIDATNDPGLLQMFSNWPELTEKSFILLDGDSSVGKTNWIAPALARFTGLTPVPVDDYYMPADEYEEFLKGNPEQLPYRLNRLKYDELCKAIRAAQSLKGCILDTVCALEIEQHLTRSLSLTINRDYHIFVQHSSGPQGGSSDKEDLRAYTQKWEPLGRCDRRLSSEPRLGQPPRIKEVNRCHAIPCQ